MFFQQFGDDFVFALELVPEGGDGPQARLLGRNALLLESLGTIFEQQLLSGEVEGERELVLVSEVSDGHLRRVRAAPCEPCRMAASRAGHLTRLRPREQSSLSPPAYVAGVRVDYPDSHEAESARLAEKSIGNRPAFLGTVPRAVPSTLPPVEADPWRW